jgi:hypothetical protein
MIKKLIVFGAILLVAAAARVRADIQYGGYLSFAFLKGQSESEDSRGSLRDIQGGLVASGLISSKFGFTLEARARTESLFEIDQAWVGFLASKAFNVKAGMYLVPFGNWNQNSRPYQTLLAETPLNLEYLYPESWRDLGLLVDGQVSVFTYAAYVGNGLKEADSLMDGQQFRDNNRDLGKGGRLGLLLGEEIRAGVSYSEGKYDDLNERTLKLEGADLAWVTKQWEVWGEATRALIDNPDPYPQGKSEGYSIWVVMSYARLQPVGSFQKVKYEDPFHGGEGIALDQSRWTVGLRFVLGPNMFIKAEYNWNNETPKIKNNVFRVQAALGF